MARLSLGSRIDLEEIYAQRRRGKEIVDPSALCADDMIHLYVVARTSDGKIPLVLEDKSRAGIDMPRDMLGFMGGKVEVGETLIEAAVREVQQEGNMHVEVEESGFITMFPIRRDKRGRTLFGGYRGFIASTEGARPGRDQKDLYFFTEDELERAIMEGLVRRNHVQLWREHQAKFVGLGIQF